MNNDYRINQNLNCECQCHYPSSIICPITSCCHCIPNNFSPFSSISSFYKPGNGQNNLMNSYSTNFRSNNEESIGFQNSGYNFDRNYNIKRTRNNQNELGRNFSEPNIHLYNNFNNDKQNEIISNTLNLDEQNIIQHEPFMKSNSNNNLKNFLSYSNYNSIPINNNSSLNNIKKDNLTYNYYESQNKNDFESNNNTIINNNNQNNIKCCPVLCEKEKAHDMISILEKENEHIKNQRDDALNKLSAIENIKNIDRVKFEELEKENNELRLLLNDAIKKNNEKDTYILNLKDDINNLHNVLHDKDREINDLLNNMKRLEHDANNEIDKLKNKIEDIKREKEAQARKYEKEINDLNNIIRDLNNKLADEERKVKELLNKIKNMKRFDDKKQKLLENLFNWYNTINKLLNTNTANGKSPSKELLNDIVNLQTNEEFKEKLDQIEDKLKQFLDNYKLKFGECFACDIACCTSETDRLRYFRKYYPGPPKNYLEGRKKCKCP